MEHYRDISPWTLNDGKVSVVTDNEHLGLIVSGSDEEQKNVDKNIGQCRNSLFGLLGPALSYKCKISPLAQLHLWKVYSLPVLRSGLSALPIRPTVMKSLSVFNNKILRGFLKLVLPFLTLTIVLHLKDSCQSNEQTNNKHDSYGSK